MPRVEDYPETHEDAVNLVKAVFEQMGGTVLPPKRPGHRPNYHTILDQQRDDFMRDFENACLSQHWDSSKRPHPKGKRRHEDAEWAAMIQSQVYPHFCDIDWEEYVEWCESGFGDEWFQEELEEELEEPPTPPSQRPHSPQTQGQCPYLSSSRRRCECGVVVTHNNLGRHRLSKRHIQRCPPPSFEPARVR